MISHIDDLLQNIFSWVRAEYCLRENITQHKSPNW
jgi:hypothetical protein